MMVDFIAQHPLISGALAWALYYTYVCWRWPFRDCWACDGGKKYQNKKRKRWYRPGCWRCKGRNQVRRWGRSAWSHFYKTKRKAKA